MGKQFEQLTPDFIEWIEQQHLFFVASAPLSAEGRVNLSPKGHDCLRILDENTVAYLDMTGSGNETSAHIAENGRITMMWCGFEGAARILRLYGRGEVILPESDRWQELYPLFDPLPGARQIVVNHVEMVQTSCGYAVPFMDYKEERLTLQKWANNKGEDGIQDYHQEKNMQSLDGLKTPLADHYTK